MSGKGTPREIPGQKILTIGIYRNPYCLRCRLAGVLVRSPSSTIRHSIRCELQSKLCCQGSYGTTCLVTNTRRNCSSRSLHYVRILRECIVFGVSRTGSEKIMKKKGFVVSLSPARIPHDRYGEKASLLMLLKPLDEGRPLEKQART